MFLSNKINPWYSSVLSISLFLLAITGCYFIDPWRQFFFHLLLFREVRPQGQLKSSNSGAGGDAGTCSGTLQQSRWIIPLSCLPEIMLLLISEENTLWRKLNGAWTVDASGVSFCWFMHHFGPHKNDNGMSCHETDIDHPKWKNPTDWLFL